jgi:5-methylcytosine-specific restriction endonuclease McrA
VYLAREIYVLFHPEDIHTNHLKHNQIYNKYCSSSNEVSGPHNLCVNALHYEKVIDESSFCERLRHWAQKNEVFIKPGMRQDSDAWDKKFQKWVKDLTKVLTCQYLLSNFSLSIFEMTVTLHQTNFSDLSKTIPQISSISNFKIFAWVKQSLQDKRTPPNLHAEKVPLTRAVCSSKRQLETTISKLKKSYEEF